MSISHNFLLWTWIGCALIFLLGPWPDEPGRKTSTPPSKMDQIGWVLLLAAVSLLPGLLMFLAPLPKLGYLAMYGLLFLVLCWDILLLLMMLMPWPRYFPKLSEPPPRAKMGTPGTALLLVLPWLAIGTYFMGTFRGLFSGRLFVEKFDQRWLGWSLDQSNLSCGFFRYTFIMAALMAYVAAVRWLADRRGLWRRGAFILFSLPLFLFPFSYLTCIAYGLLLYIQTLGFTTMRVLGLLYGAPCYVHPVRLPALALELLHPSPTTEPNQNQHERLFIDRAEIQADGHAAEIRRRTGVRPAGHFENRRRAGSRAAAPAI